MNLSDTKKLLKKFEELSVLCNEAKEKIEQAIKTEDEGEGPEDWVQATEAIYETLDLAKKMRKAL